MICEKCKMKLALDKVLQEQVHLVANKPKYDKETFKALYDELEEQILKINPEFYRG